MNNIKLLKNQTYLPTIAPHIIESDKLDHKALAFWSSTGFFLDEDSFWENVQYTSIESNSSRWFYNPQNLSLEQSTEAFCNIFETIVEELTQDNNLLLPLSGGLDSRTLAVALKRLGKTPAFTYSYRFTGSFAETRYGADIAKAMGWPFQAYDITPGYLWNKIEWAGQLNQCYAEFTHVRQVAVVEEIAQRGDLWLLGHWGDVLFDDMGVPDDLPFDEQIGVLKRKVLKKGGPELAADLWQAWGLPGQFETVLEERLRKMHARIPIENANARIRAFKSMYWATRWTTTNLIYFQHFHPMALPYYDDRMCEFIMQVPEKWLAGRQIQIEYIKRYGGQLGYIPWQDKAPYHLHNYQHHRTWRHLPYRVAGKASRLWKAKVLGRPLVQRNWEIQFLGKANDQQLRNWLFENPHFDAFVPRSIVQKYYQRFQTGDQVYWSHPLSMLLTLSVFAKMHRLGNQ